ncbi:MAG: chemotaxis protein CheB [Epsilonproteobacteria bacterium]|nr:chemotaxis protein CheB [Campylobacterota bacterium]
MKIVLIGASTGGPNKIQKILSSLEELNDTSVIIAQHIRRDFFPSFVSNLKKYTKFPLKAPQNNEKITPSTIYVVDEKTTQKNNRFVLEKSPHFNPDINELFKSFVNSNNEILAVILTGIGDDGVEGIVQLKNKGAVTATEDSASAIVDGMPARARERGIKAYPFEEIIKLITRFSK